MKIFYTIMKSSEWGNQKWAAKVDFASDLRFRIWLMTFKILHLLSSWKWQEFLHHLKSWLTVERTSRVDWVTISSSWVLSVLNCVFNRCSVKHVVNDGVSEGKIRMSLSFLEVPRIFLLWDGWDHWFNLIGSTNAGVIVSRSDEMADSLLHACVWVNVVLSHEVIETVHHVSDSSFVVVCNMERLRVARFLMTVQ